MGFFDYLMKGIGFETEGTVPVTSSKKTKNKEVLANENSNQELPFQFDFPSYDLSEQIGDDMQVQAMQNGVASAKNVIVYNPKNQTDIKNLIDFLRRKEPIIVNFTSLPTNVSSSMISFISGALYALRGSIHPIANNLYLLTPEGVSILVPKNQVQHSHENENKMM